MAAEFKEKKEISVGPKKGEGMAMAAVAILFLLSIFTVIMGLRQWRLATILPGLFMAILAASCIRVARQWEKAVVLRVGRLHRVVGPGPFTLLPGVDIVAAKVDQRVITTTFNAEETLTKDTVPVDVDAVLFWVVWDPARAITEVADYQGAVAWAAQTALREVIGRKLLSEILAAREDLDEELRLIIDHRTEPWGIAVQAVEIRDVIIPDNLQEAMSREAQAERERRARIILGTAETEIAYKFAEAAKAYAGNEVALQLRAMNILYEGLKEGGGLVVVPSNVPHSMGLDGIGGIGGVSYLKEKLLQKKEEDSKQE